MHYPSAQCKKDLMAADLSSAEGNLFAGVRLLADWQLNLPFLR
jgi:hypothetical protein